MATVEENRQAGDEKLTKAAAAEADDATAARLTGLAIAHALLAIAGELSGIRRELAKRKR